MSDAEITAILTAPPPAPPATPGEAATRLSTLSADAEWRGKFLAGNGPQVREWNELHQLAANGDNIDMAMAGKFLPGGQSSEHIVQMETAAMMQELGIRSEIIRDALSDKHTVTRAEFEATKVWKADRMTDPEFTKRWLAGDREAKRKMMLADIILTGNVKEDAA